MLNEPNNPIKSIRITDGLWHRMLERNRLGTLPHCVQQCEQHGLITNVEIAAGLSDAEYQGGPDRDSDLFKVIEGAAYTFAQSADESLDAYLDAIIAKIAKAQADDGYLQTYITSQKPDERFVDLQRAHELYCHGHLFEAAVAHAEATGKRELLEVAVRLADHLDGLFGPGKREAAPGHQEVELALVRLYKLTGEARYLNLSKYFVDERGTPGQLEREYRGKPIDEGDRRPGRNRPPAYRQDHARAVDQRYATGHAVRAGYLYAAMADLAREAGDDEYAVAAKAIWRNIVERKLYITGGVGTHQYFDEGFGDDYTLPHDGYCETCGGIAMMQFSRRMNLLTGEAKYADVVELTMLNHFLSSTDATGREFFYRNLLVSDGTRRRHPWPNPACCPSNIVRTVPQVARELYAITDRAVYVNQFAASVASLTLGGASVTLTQQTDYPWDGRVMLTVDPAEPTAFALHLRVPGWTDGRPVPSDLYSADTPADPVTITVNGEAIDAAARRQGYCVIDRMWQAGDVVSMDMPMPVQRVRAHVNVEACRGQVALMRGPMLYCFEQVDLGCDPAEITLDRSIKLMATHEPGLLGGVTVVHDEVSALRAVPFAVWNNRKPGGMAVWVREG